MKKCFLALCVFACTVAFAAPAQNSGSVQWQTDYSTAADQASKDNKKILLFFTGSDWCGWCKKLDQEVFSKPAFAQAIGDKFVFVEVDFPMNKPLPAKEQEQNNALKKKFGITGYPTVIILDSKGNFVAETGYRPGGAEAYAEYLNQLAS